MQRLEDLIGRKIIVALMNSEEAGYTVTLHGVESGGIWIESKIHARLLGHSPKKSQKVHGKPPAKPLFVCIWTTLHAKIRL